MKEIVVNLKMTCGVALQLAQVMLAKFCIWSELVGRYVVKNFYVKFCALGGLVGRYVVIKHKTTNLADNFDSTFTILIHTLCFFKLNF